MTDDDPLVTLWRKASRPLNWRAWKGIRRHDQARFRYILIRQLQILDSELLPSFWWRDTHRELLELKTLSGHEGQSVC